MVDGSSTISFRSRSAGFTTKLRTKDQEIVWIDFDKAYDEGSPLPKPEIEHAGQHRYVVEVLHPAVQNAKLRHSLKSEGGYSIIPKVEASNCLFQDLRANSIPIKCANNQTSSSSCPMTMPPMP